MPSVMGSTETAVIDSSEFISGRVALELDKLGIHVREANWGDSDIELFMVKQELGEIPAERHPPNRTVTMKLLVTREGGISFAEALSKLQAKVNTLQESGGWIKRIMDSRGQFKRAVGAIVYKASLTGVDGWYMGHRGAAPEVTLVMTCSPYFYATEEVEGNAVTVSNGHDVEWEIVEPIGTAPGLLRLEIENKNAGTSGDWHGAISAIEARDHSGANTAKMGYLASELTKLGNSEAGARTGSIGAATVKSKLVPTYQPVLGSKITASGQMTHTGPRNLLVRVWDPNATPGNIHLKLQWKALGSDFWTENEEVVTTLVAGFCIMNLGECRPETAVLGNQTWEWRLLGRATSANQEIELDKFWVLPTEQYLSLVYEKESEAFSPVVLEQIYGPEAPGAVTGSTPTVGGKFESFGDAVGLTYRGSISIIPNLATSTIMTRAEFSDTVANFTVSSTNIPGNQVFQGTMENTGGNVIGTQRTTGSMFGFVLRFTSAENWLGLVVKQEAANEQYFQIIKCVAGVKTVLKKGLAGIGTKRHGVTKIMATLTEEGEITAAFFSSPNNSGTVSVTTLNTIDAALNKTGALKEGKTGTIDLAAGATESDKEIRSYGYLVANKPESEERGAVCYAGKKMELRSDGCFRESVGEASWARLTPLGFMPYLKPGGLEARPMRGIFIPTRGDFETKADSESNSISIKYRYRPAYLFTSGVS